MVRLLTVKSLATSLDLDLKLVLERGGAWTPEPLLFAGFASLFQGDHLGVEFAFCSHQNLLEEAGLLKDSQQIRGLHPFPRGPHYSSLVIDDFFIPQIAGKL